MKSIIQINRFAELHNDETIVFCKTDYILQDFNRLSYRTKPLIFISGNSDYPIDNDLIKRMPKCIVKWFAQNYIGELNDIVEPIPLGIENSFPAIREGHGVGWEHAIEKLKFLSQYHNQSNIYNNFAYVNFHNWTNPHHRQLVKEKCRLYDHFTMQSDVDFPKFVSDILDHKCVVCAQGNGLGDNHRIYESLYLNRIPILFNKYMYKSLHYKFPNIFIDRIEQLGDLKWLEEQQYTAYERADKNWQDLVTASYWISRIKKFEKAIK